MVSHTCLHLLDRDLVVGNNPQRHIFGIFIFTQCPWEITVEALVKMTEETPNACVAESAPAEIGSCIYPLPREIGVHASKPSLRTSKADYILGIKDILLVLHIEFAYAALVGMGTNGIVGNTHSHPNHALGTRSLAHHLHNPSLVGVTDGKCLATTTEAVSLCQRGHHLNSFAGRAATLKRDVYKATIIKNTGRVYHLFTSTIGGFADSNLIFVDIANHIICNRCLGDGSMIFTIIPIINLAHSSLGMNSRRIVGKIDEHAIIIGIISADDRTIGRSLFSHNKIGTGHTACTHQ